MADMPMIYSSLTAAAAAITSVKKNNKNQQQGWNFRSIDDVYNALQPALVSAGLTIVPNVKDREITSVESKDKYGNTRTVITARLLMEYTVYAQDGSSVTCSTLGEGIDFGDKACNKAMAIAYKYMAFQLFCIPTEQMRRDDPDFYVPHEQEVPKPVAVPSPAKKSATVAEKSKTIAEAQIKASKGAKLKQLANILKVTEAEVKDMWKVEQDKGKIPAKACKDMTDEEFDAACDHMVSMYG